MPSGAYWFRKNYKFHARRISYNAARRQVWIDDAAHDAIFLSGEVKSVDKRNGMGGP